MNLKNILMLAMVTSACVGEIFTVHNSSGDHLTLDWSTSSATVPPGVPVVLDFGVPTLVGVYSAGAQVGSFTLQPAGPYTHEIVLGPSGVTVVPREGSNGYFWLGFLTGFGWMGFGYILNLVRQIGRVTPEV